jgi:hypothetical protein
MSTLAIVSCGKSKLSRAAPARDLYTGPSFKDALGYATAPGRFDEVLILSARHGLLELDRVIKPYDTKLLDLDVGDRAELVTRVYRTLFGRLPSSVTILAGAPYVELLGEARERLVPPLRPVFETPLAHMGTGARRAWFKAQREAAR